MTGGFYVDADDQRQKARWAEQRLLEHDAQRQPRSRPLYPEEDQIESNLPPVFRKEGYYASARETSVDRRSARFRDGEPPPPAPPSQAELRRVLPPPGLPLMDQQAFDQGEIRPASPLSDPIEERALVGAALRPPLMLPELGEAAQNTRQNLSISQKKRLRRKLKKQSLRGEAPPRPAPFPLSVDSRASNGVHPTHPQVPNERVRTACEAEVIVQMSDHTTHRLRCPLTPFPHPGQPHLIQLASATPDQAEIFIGFWLAGE